MSGIGHGAVRVVSDERHQLHIDRILCDGHGLCAGVLPEMVQLDDWGYPVIDPRPIPPQLMPHARRAASLCPLLALRLRAVPPGAPRSIAGHGRTASPANSQPVPSAPSAEPATLRTVSQSRRS
jgi:ferredoxin